MTQIGGTHERWESAHALPRFRPKYPHEEVVRWAFRRLDRHASPPQKVLDHGCGAGRHAIFFAAEGFDTHACDFSRLGLEHLAMVARDLGSIVTTHQCLGYDLSHYASGIFRGILSFGVLYYMTLSEAEEAIREKYRVLANGGHVFCVLRTNEDSRMKFAKNIGPSTWRIESLDASAPSDMEAGTDLLFFSEPEVASLFSLFETVAIDRMTLVHSGFRNDDWLIYATKR